MGEAMNSRAHFPKQAGTRRSLMALAVIAAALLAARTVVPERALDVAGWRALYDSAFALALLSVVMFVALGAGWRTSRARAPEQGMDLEGAVISAALGLAIIGYGIFALGLLGLFNWWAMTAWVLALAFWGRREILAAGELGRLGISRLGDGWRKLTPPKRFVVLAWLVLLGMAVLQALAPPWDYDGLMYHLQGPRLFLEAGRVLFLPENWQANGPFTVEMLFSLGLSLGSDTFAKLVHTTFAVLLVFSTFALGRRSLGSAAGWISLALMAGVPLYSFWASLAYADMAWALYQTLMLICLLRWEENHHRGSLVLAGLFAGLAAGCKYLGLSAVAIGGLWLVWKLRGQAWRDAARSAALYFAVAVAVASPWYLKNLVMAGNPVFPFLFGGQAWDEARLQLLMEYLGSFGTGHSALDYLMLPWNLFTQSSSFGTFMRALEVPNVLFVLALLYPIGRRTRGADSIAVFAAGGFLLWSAGSQQIRFLLPLFAPLGVCAAGVILKAAEWAHSRRWVRPAGILLLALPVSVALFWSGFLLWYARPLPVVFGAEAKSQFLERRVSDFAVIQYLMQQLSPDAKVLMMWDGQGYYCDERCLPDTDQSQWVRIAASRPAPAALVADLQQAGISHLLFSHDSDFFLQEHDPHGLHRSARDYFLDEFAPVCARVVRAGGWVDLYELTCRQADG